ncbi:histidine kinase [Algoriphagus sp. D3-2-R+10]|uniref:sensor histidine kinase n=1 Tax=Algoriphagus aurantiacus TaxID=3103948 RepID=UPI002B3AE3E3|nr:histidine kinase [Algoriphagus sp. D3-2-R+10]MEB2776391.1 histidine kinase [Algoriphagus sp. D3-2-R+10]
MNITLKNSWFYRYKLYHLPFWALYHYLWLTYYEENITAFTNFSFPPLAINFLFFVIFQALGVYFCLYFLIPRLLEKDRLLLFLISVFLTILVVSLILMSGYFIGTELFGYDPYEVHFKNKSPWVIFKNSALPSTVSTMTFGMSIKLAKSWLISQSRRRELEKEKLETELKFLKSQFNPHFLFNTINSIFVLIDKNTAMASESLAKFSGLLRYQLYECNESQIPLEREIAYIQSFIELEELRQNANFELQTDLAKNTNNLAIAPFILMPFIENAFKHVAKDGKDTKNWIKIVMHIENNQMAFSVKNNVCKNGISEVDVVKYNGLGLKNVQRRLDLLYPDAHKMEIIEANDVFEVSLLLHLKENQKFEKAVND